MIGVYKKMTMSKVYNLSRKCKTLNGQRLWNGCTPMGTGNRSQGIKFCGVTQTQKIL